MRAHTRPCRACATMHARHLEHPSREGDEAGVAHVAAALMEAHHAAPRARARGAGASARALVDRCRRGRARCEACARRAPVGAGARIWRKRGCVCVCARAQENPRDCMRPCVCNCCVRACFDGGKDSGLFLGTQRRGGWGELLSLSWKLCPYCCFFARSSIAKIVTLYRLTNQIVIDSARRKAIAKATRYSKHDGADADAALAT